MGYPQFICKLPNGDVYQVVPTDADPARWEAEVKMMVGQKSGQPQTTIQIHKILQGFPSMCQQLFAD